MHESLTQVASLAFAGYDLLPPITSFALSHQGGSNASVGLHSGAGDLVWKTYTSLHTTASIHYEHRLLVWLAAPNLSFAVPVPITTRRGALLFEGQHGRASLARRFSGVNLDPCQPAHVELYGAVIGELQAALTDYPREQRPGRQLFTTLLRFPQSCDPFALTPAQLDLPDTSLYTNLLNWWRAEAAALQVFIDGPYQALPQQVCHNDMAPTNLLVDGERVSAVLDFEFAAPVARALDLAMGLRMAARVWENPQPWDIIRSFYCGYRRWVTLTETEIRALPWLLRLRTALPIVWWLGHERDPAHLAVALRGIGYLRVMVNWLNVNEQRFVEVVSDAAA